MSFNIQHGGLIRKSGVVASTESTYWTKGRVLGFDTNGQIAVNTDPATFKVVGLALEDRPSASANGVTTTKTIVGAPSGEQASMLLDQAVVTMEQNLESGVTFTAGNKLYVSTNGKVTTSGATLGANAMPSSSPIIGEVITGGSSGDVSRPITFLFKVEY
jgi:hypothetical protein